MTSYFADTSYYVSLLDGHDAMHAEAQRLTPTLKGHIVTTAYVLLELSAYFARPPYRGVFLTFAEQLRQGRYVTIIPAEQTLFDRGWTLYASHRDKSWSLVDCISFVVMREQSIHEVLTTDHHYEQAGFRALLKS
jgi:hypothetical protein